MEHNEDKGFTRRDFMGTAARTAFVLTLVGGVPKDAFADTASEKTERSMPITTDFDIIIASGTIYDGTAADPYRADIGIRGDKLVAIGRITGKAAKIIDAQGLTITPGFIDVHTHCDMTFQEAGVGRYLAYVLPSFKGNYNYLYQGVTTVVTGNCGYGYVDTNYWLDLVNAMRFGTNVYHLAPHGMIREALFGTDQRSGHSRKEIEALKNKVAEEMQKGTLGFSTGLAYAPGLLTQKEEIIEIAKVVRKYGGIYTTHIRDESGQRYADGTIGVVEAINEAIDIGRRAEIPVEISHIKIDAPINSVKASQILEPIEKARAEGLDIHADQYPYDAGSTRITILLPNGFVTSTGIKDIYKTKEGRKEVKAAIEQVFAYLPPEKTLITMYLGKPSYEGQTIKEIAEREGKSPSGCYVDLVCEGKAPFGVFFSQNMDIVRDLMPHDYIITGSDGWTVPKGLTKPHPRVYGTFPKKLRQFVLQEKRMGLKEAFISMTSLPAKKFNMQGRGRITEGHYADIAVIDLNTITDHATYTNPHQYATGVVHLLVNGVLALENGKATGERGGRALRRG